MAHAQAHETFKVLLLGDSAVGKSSLMAKLTGGPGATGPTTGVDLASHKVVVDGVQVSLRIWDTAGQERFRSL